MTEVKNFVVNIPKQFFIGRKNGKNILHKLMVLKTFPQNTQSARKSLYLLKIELMNKVDVPHSLDNSYPFVNPVSIEIYPIEERLGGIIGIQDQVINMNKPEMEKRFGLEPGVDAATFDKAFYLGMTERVVMAEQALMEVEGQVLDMMKDMPFIPESFEFEHVVTPGEDGTLPINIYKSKLNSGVLLVKEYGEDTKWTIMKDGIKTTFDFPCKRVAICVFYAMGIEVARQTDCLKAISPEKELKSEN